MAIDLTVNGVRHSVDVAPETPLLWVIRDHAWADRHQIQLRHCAMRRLHAAYRRSTRSLLQRSGLGRGRQGCDHDRRLVARWHTSRAARLDRARRAAMRLLPIGHDHERCGSAEADTQIRPMRRSTPRSPMRAAAARITASARRSELAAARISAGGEDSLMSNNDLNNAEPFPARSSVRPPLPQRVLSSSASGCRSALQAQIINPEGAAWADRARSRRSQRLGCRRARRNRDRPHRPDRARPGCVDLQCHDRGRGTAMRLEQGEAAIRIRQSRRQGNGAGMDAQGHGQRRDRSHSAAASPSSAAATGRA